MKTFLVVTFYAVMVAAVDLGGAVWHQYQSLRQGKATVAVIAAQPAQIASAPRAFATIPSDT